MGFSVTKAAIFGLSTFAGLTGGLMLTGGLGSTMATLAFAAVTAAAVGGVFGVMMRDASVNVAAATSESVATAMRSTWTLRRFKAEAGPDGAGTEVAMAALPLLPAESTRLAGLRSDFAFGWDWSFNQQTRFPLSIGGPFTGSFGLVERRRSHERLPQP